ncbi:GtrA family protein [Candidatus Saccharibacteria bacterium]|nr:GtrA family protein [Candidatus Saccharibacteria bacterium]
MSKKRAEKYFFLGLLNTAIGYGVYEVLALTVFSGEGQLPIASLISGVVSIFTGYYLHSHYTWRGRQVGKRQVVRFFIWNIISATAIKPSLTWVFEFPKFLYQLAFDICQAIHIPFSYEFVASTGNFVLVTAVIMVINFLIYDRFVFGKKKEKAEEEDKDGARSEDQRKTKE